jgi:hypothetical protein
MDDCQYGGAMRRISVLVVCGILLAASSVMGQGARVSHLWPGGGPNNQSVTAYVYGDSFAVAPPSVRLLRSGCPDVVAGSLNIISQRYLTCVFDLLGSATGLYDLSVVNAFGGDTLPRCFSIYTVPDLPPVWERTSVGFGGSYMNSVAVGDGDGDGSVDVFGANTDGTIYRFEWGGLNWTTSTVGSGTDVMYSVAVGDGNDDGVMEVYGASGDSTLYQFKWSGSDWTKTIVGSGGWHMYGLAVGDGNWDTQQEVYGANGDSVLYQYKWNGLSWDETVVGTGDWYMYAVAVGDGNSDNQMEVYAANTDSSVYQFKWNGATWAKTVVATGWGPMLGVAVGDGNGDGEQEVYSASQDGDIYQSKWNGLSWDVTTVGSGSSGMFGVAVGDGDGDGNPEVYCANLDDSLYRFEWDGGGWIATTLGAGTSDMSGLAMGDGNNDGKMEVYGACWDNLIYQFRPTSSPDIDVSDTLYDFGSVPIGDSLDWDNLIVRNTGTGTLIVGGIVSDNVAYTVVSPSFADTILPQDSSLVTVRFKPQAEGAIPGTLTVFSNDPDESPMYIAVNGEGYVPGIAESTARLRVFSVSPARNPMLEEVAFYLTTPGRGDVVLSIYDVTGRLVEVPMKRELGAGTYEVTCRSKMSSGVYFYRVASPWGTPSGRVVLLR